MGICQVPKIVIGSKNTEQGSLKIFGKNINTISLGDATHEGGNIIVYRDASGNAQLTLDADAASNAIALSVYGGVVAQNFLTVGQASLNAGYALYINGSISGSGAIVSGSTITTGASGSLNIGTVGIVGRGANQASIPINIVVSGTDSTNHAIKLQIDANDIIVAQATGDGSGGITDKHVELYGYTSWIGTTGGFNVKIAEATGTATAAATFDIEVDIPSGARILGCQLRVDTALTSSDGGTTWSAAFIDGSTSAVAAGAAFAQNTKVNTMYNANAANDIASAETDIRVTCDGGKTFVADGQVKAIVYYEDFTAMGDA